jgi:HlyD family secretion protein
MARGQDGDSAERERALKVILWVLLLAAVGGGLWWAVAGRSSLPEVKFIHPRRETLVSNLPTNAKVEPIEWAPVRVETPGLVTKVYVRLGETVAPGAAIVQVSITGLTDQVNAAAARTAQAQADLDALTKGGSTATLAEIESSLAKAKFERDMEQKDYGSLKRLYDKQAATMVEVELAKDKLHATDLEIESLERRRTALVGKDELAAARARLQEAQAAQHAAEAKLSQGAIRTPVGGVVYNLPVRLGAYLNAGDLVAEVGQVSQLRIRVYVDEPELGAVAVGQPVKITWDALPAKEWSGKVEHMPTEIVPLGTRQVGEVLCNIDNPDGELAPGANVNASIQTSLVPNALTIPKEALHIDSGQAAVYVLGGDNTLRLRPVQHGSDSVTRAQIAGGLKDDEWVALPSETLPKDGLKIKAVLEK